MRSEKRNSAGEIKDNVGFGHRTVPRTREAKPIARGGSGRCEVVDRQLEGAKMAARIADRALYDGKIPDPVRRDIARTGKQHSDVQLLGELPARIDRRFVAAIDQNDAVARKCN